MDRGLEEPGCTLEATWPSDPAWVGADAIGCGGGTACTAVAVVIRPGTMRGNGSESRGDTDVTHQIATAAVKGEEVSIAGFGKFTVKDRPEREGRNPGTGEPITIAALKKVAFTAAKGLKDKL